VYLLHVFKKKSKAGRGTPRGDLEVIKFKLKTAGEHYARTYGTDE
jgi:phage-related protein